MYVVYIYNVCIHTLLQGLEVMEVTSAYQCCQVWLERTLAFYEFSKLPYAMT